MGRPRGAGGWISPRSRLGQWMNRRWWHVYVELGVINTLLWFLASYIGVLGGRSEHRLRPSLFGAIFFGVFSALAMLAFNAWDRRTSGREDG